MAKIELLFGSPSTHDEEISVENYAYSCGISIEAAVIRQFGSWINGLSNKADDQGNTFFELLLFIGVNEMLGLPKITAGTYRHKGFVLPKMIIHGNRGIDKRTGNSIFLTEGYVNTIGSNFEDEIGYEYFECRQIQSGRLARALSFA